MARALPLFPDDKDDDDKVFFDGETYDPGLDKPRLTSQLWRVYAVMEDGQWRTLERLQQSAGGSEAGVSARLRDLRKARFGGYTVESRRIHDSGLWEYRLVPRK